MSGTLPFERSISLNDKSPINGRRKLSFPALHPPSLLGDSTALSARRRLSNVSDKVTRKFSHTIGWKIAQIPSQDIINQGKCLCGQYIKRRLKRSGLFNRKLGLQRIRSIIGTGADSASVVREVFPTLMVLGDELERMHPRTYSGVFRQISRAPGGEIPSAEAISIILGSVGRELFRLEITWGKIISLFAIAGGLAVDCVRQGHPDYLPGLVEGVTEVIEDELTTWVNEKGGWMGLNSHVLPASNKLTKLEWTSLVIGFIFALFIIFVLLRIIITYLIPLFFNKS
ncbi:unnamed protein product [Hermetia illucens]|uniref:Bcl-2 Bcl-2 homology region 1-3 domain-containing protein n=1 Tax=Hermetia illucens TaxID=343691 RepID=A0A7R8UYD2_HERIL|nr:bcl-2-related ovarian killer protein [Hermetia illucens]XP_037917279.1 bcl-2-related ovarian killer protein [Hermetia illucens]XP_037917280.1 bcl-2-related ovarian killer protein [Hermetia illucens]CAD7089287.1 unnamed protein product [Hermetia illucens]